MSFIYPAALHVGSVLESHSCTPELCATFFEKAADKCNREKNKFPENKKAKNFFAKLFMLIKSSERTVLPTVVSHAGSDTTDARQNEKSLSNKKIIDLSHHRHRISHQSELYLKADCVLHHFLK